MVVLILMAGMGTRTKEMAPDIPKPMLMIHGVPMINWVISNFSLDNSRYVFVVQKAVNEKYHLHQYFSKLKIPFEIVELNGPNGGAAVSALAAKGTYINEELLIVNSDQFVLLDMNLFIAKARESHCDGMILTMQEKGPKWSYVRLSDEKKVVEVAEKKEISDTATVGAYWFKRGSDFVSAAEQMINQDDRTKNEFYLAPVYNYLIQDAKEILDFNIKNYDSPFFGLGTTEDIQKFIANPLSSELAQKIRVGQ